MIRKAIILQDKIQIRFPFNNEDLNKIRSLPGRRYNPDGKYWTCPVGVDSIESLEKWGFELDEELRQILERSKIDIRDMKTIDVPGLKKQLYPFQRKGVAFIEARNGRALIADEMGLGKTIQALGYLQLHQEKRPAVIVSPASVKLNWNKELQVWMPDPRVEVLSGRKPYPIHGRIIVINYDILDSWVETLQALNPQVIVTDECHYYKSNKAQRTRAIKKLARGVPHVIALSGTPIVNRPIEAYNALRLIDATVMPDFWQYARRYCNARNNGFGWDFNGASNTAELNEKLTHTIMIRRRKQDVLQDLPEKTRSFVPLELDNTKQYNEARDRFIEFIQRTKGHKAAARASNAEQLTQVETLKQVAVQGKLAGVIEWIHDFLASGEKLVLFAIHRFVIERLMAEFGDVAVRVDGSVSLKSRENAIQQFTNNSAVQLFIGNIQAAGAGINLTAASSVAFLELPWTPGGLVQAEDRCHRIGQRDSVNIYYLLADNTIESKIARLLDRKRQVLDSVLDGVVTEQESLLSELIKTYNDETL